MLHSGGEWKDRTPRHVPSPGFKAGCRPLGGTLPMAEGGRVERPRLIARRVSTALPSPIGLTFRMLIALLQRMAVATASAFSGRAHSAGRVFVMTGAAAPIAPANTVG